MGAGKVDAVNGNDDGCQGGSRSGDNGVEVRVDANVVVIVVDKDWGGRGQRHAARIKQ